MLTLAFLNKWDVLRFLGRVGECKVFIFIQAALEPSVILLSAEFKIRHLTVEEEK
jgi:hypothetical protein